MALVKSVSHLNLNCDQFSGNGLERHMTTSASADYRPAQVYFPSLLYVTKKINKINKNLIV